MYREHLVTNLKNGSFYYNEKLEDTVLIGYVKDVFIMQSLVGILNGTQWILCQSDLMDSLDGYELIGYI